MVDTAAAGAVNTSAMCRDTKGARNMEVHRRDVSPETAEVWLGFNTRNRHVRPLVVAQYARAMREGEWRNDIDPVAFAGYLADGVNGSEDKHPVLMNGQHRLHALVRSGVTLPLLIAEGLELNDQLEMDSGTRRQLADHLRLRGITSSSETAAVLRLVWQYEAGAMRERATIPSYTALVQYLEKHEDIAEAVAPARRLYIAIGGRVSVYGAGYFILTHFIDDAGAEEDADEFFHLLITGESLPNGSPLLAFRNAVMTSYSPMGTRRRMSQVQMLALLFKAWNAWRDGVRLSTLTWRGGGKSPEAFPVPQ